MIVYQIQRRTGVAAYTQIVQQTRAAMLLGRLRVGDQLPTAREVVEHTGINPNTVLKAYRQLDAEGLVETRAGSGTFVIALPDHAETLQGSTVFEGLATTFQNAKASGLSRHDVESLVKAQLDAVYSKGAQ